MEDNKSKNIKKTLGVLVALAGGFVLIKKGSKLLSSAKMKFALLGFKVHKLDASVLQFDVTLRCYNPTKESNQVAINGVTAFYNGGAIANSIPNIQGNTIGGGTTSDITVRFEAPYLSLLNKGILSALNNTSLLKQNLSFAIAMTVNGETLSIQQNLSDGNMESLGSLGIVSGPRNTKNAKEYNHLISKVKGEDIFIKEGGVESTVEACIDIVANHYHEVAELAIKLKGATVKESCANIFNFAYPYLQYTQDKKGVEQLRTPARSWYDGQIRFKQMGEKSAGIDCDDFSIFCGSLLKCLNIPFKFRVTKYDGKSYYQHIYVIVPDANDSEGEIVIDPVLSKFDYQAPYTFEKSDFNMRPIALAGLSGFSIDGVTNLGMPIRMLSGIDESDDDLMGIISGIDYDNAIGGLGASDDATLSYLKRTQRYVIAHPNTIAHIQNPKSFLDMLNTAIKHWHTPNRDKVLDRLIELENKLFDKGFIKYDDAALESAFDIDDELGRSSRSKRRAKRKVRRAKFFSSIKKGTKKVGTGLKKAAKAVVRFNPVSLAIRGGLLAALRLNMFKFSSKLKYAYLPDNLANKYNLTVSDLRKIKAVHHKVLKLFRTLQGKPESLKKAILKGAKQKGTVDFSLKGKTLQNELNKLNGLGDLGVIATATSVTAASGVLAKIGGWLDPIKNVFKKIKTKVVAAKDKGKNVNPSRNKSENLQPLTPLSPAAQRSHIQPPTPTLVTNQSRNEIAPRSARTNAPYAADAPKSKMKSIIGLIAGATIVGGGIYYYTTRHKNTPRPKAKPKRSLKGIELK